MPRLSDFSAWKNRPIADLRGGTRIPCEIRLSLMALDSAYPFYEPCLVVLVSPKGCATKFSRPLEIGTRVRLEGLPITRGATAQVVNCISLGRYEKFWLVELALDDPGNVWGIEEPPEDWNMNEAGYKR
jgi:hypothetical protein